MWTNLEILLIRPLGTNFSEISFEIHTFSFKKMHLKMSFGKWQPFLYFIYASMFSNIIHLHWYARGWLHGVHLQPQSPKRPWPRFNIKLTSYQNRKSHCGDKTILRPSYLHNGISYTGKMTSLYWIRAHILINHKSINIDIDAVHIHIPVTISLKQPCTLGCLNPSPLKALRWQDTLHD